MKYFLSLGSNVGNREKNLDLALSLLSQNHIRILERSSLYETQPVDFSDQPWFLNQVIEIQTSLEPQALFILIQCIEKSLGRKPIHDKGPRILDIDILLAEDTVLQSEKLTIPHPRMEKRNFVLVPLKEISPHTVHPVLEKNAEHLSAESTDISSVFLYRKRSDPFSK